MTLEEEEELIKDAIYWDGETLRWKIRPLKQFTTYSAWAHATNFYTYRPAGWGAHHVRLCGFSWPYEDVVDLVKDVPDAGPPECVRDRGKKLIAKVLTRPRNSLPKKRAGASVTEQKQSVDRSGADIAAGKVWDRHHGKDRGLNGHGKDYRTKGMGI